MRILKLSIIALCVLSFSGLNAQFSVEKERGEHFFEKQAYATAAETYKKAYGLAKTPEDKVAMIYQVGESYRMMSEPEQAETWFRRALKVNISDNMAFYHLGRALRDQNRLDEAIEQFNKYREKGGAESKAQSAIDICKRSKEYRKNQTRYVVDPVPQLNSEYYDFGLAFANKENTKVLIGSFREGSTGIADYEKLDQSWPDLYESSQDKKGKWSEPLRLGSNINTYGAEGASCLNEAKDRLYFTRCYNDEKNDEKGCDIYVAARAGGKWGAAKKLELKPKDQGIASVGQPSLSKDGKMLFFSSNMKVDGAKGGKDIYVATYNQGSKSWSKPKNLASINTPGHDMFPYIRNNGTLYFSSDGHLGMGGLDNYMAAKTGDMEWGNVENMKAPINSSYNDMAMVFDGDEERGYMTSNRSGGKGYDDIYFFTLPDVEFKMEAYIVDKATGAMMEGATLNVVGSDGSNYEMTSDENGLVSLDKNGEESYIKPNVNYSLVASATEYLVAKDQISTSGLTESRTFVNEFLLQPVIEDVAIEFPEVRYDLGRAELQVNEGVNSPDSLNALYDILMDNLTIIVELQAHTDSRGGNGANQDLSQRRAQSCVDYLISKGIPSARMVAKGYGENRLKIKDSVINSLGTSAEKEAAHQKNRRTEFIVKSWDYVPN